MRSPIAQGNVWVLDPIDGTVNFIVQKDNFAVMLAYYEEGVGQFGIIYDVMADILYSGEDILMSMLTIKKLFLFKSVL